MKISMRQSDRATTILDVSGKIDLNNSQDFRKVLLESLEAVPVVLLNLEQVKYMDSSGIATLVEGFHKAKKLGKRIILFSLSPMVRSVLELTHLTKVFEIYENEEQAHGACSPKG